MRHESRSCRGIFPLAPYQLKRSKSNAHTSLLRRRAVARRQRWCTAITSRTEAGIHLRRGDDTDARRRAPANCDLDAYRSEGSAANSLPTHSLRCAERTASTDTNQLEGAGAGRLHLRDSEPSW